MLWTGIDAQRLFNCVTIIFLNPWQSGYGAFSVSQSAKESVICYIATQEIHHRKMTFQEEFRFLLEKHGIAFDERYAWD